MYSFILLDELVSLCRLFLTRRVHRARRCALMPKPWHAALIFVLAIFVSNARTGMAQDEDYASVSTPEELQDAVRRGVPHIIVTKNLDMASTPSSTDSRDQKDYILTIAASEEGRYTRSIRVRRAV